MANQTLANGGYEPSAADWEDADAALAEIRALPKRLPHLPIGAAADAMLALVSQTPDYAGGLATCGGCGKTVYANRLHGHKTDRGRGAHKAFVASATERRLVAKALAGEPIAESELKAARAAHFARQGGRSGVA